MDRVTADGGSILVPYAGSLDRHGAREHNDLDGSQEADYPT